MQTFTTRTEAIDYLVSIGKPTNLAKAAVFESFNYDRDGDTADLIRVGPEDSDLPLALTGEQVLLHYNTIADMMVETDEGIELDGTLLYTPEGKHLDY